MDAHRLLLYILGLLLFDRLFVGVEHNWDVPTSREAIGTELAAACSTSGSIWICVFNWSPQANASPRSSKVYSSQVLQQTAFI